MAANSMRKQVRDKRACLSHAERPRSPAVPVMPTVVAVMPPPYFRGRRLDILPDGSRGTGIAERQRVGALGRCSESKHCANRGKLDPRHKFL
jgi:hypothetical protein